MPLLDVIKPVTTKWTARYRRSPVPAFLSWWKAELVGMLPARWQQWLVDRRETWLVSIDGPRFSLHRNGVGEPVAQLDLGQSPDVVRGDLLRLVGRGPNPDRRLFLAIPGDAVLTRSLSFPSAVEQNLRQVLAFEMDRQTPFKAEQVHFDYRAEPAAGGRTLRVDLAIAPRAQVDALIEQARGLALPLDGIDVVDAAPAPRRLGFNLLPEPQRVRRSDPQRRLNLILIASALALLVLAMQQSVANRTHALDGLRANVESAREEARAVAALRGQLDNAIAGAGYLTERKRQAPSVLRVLEDVSARLPDDTWLERMTFREGGLEIAGQSAESTRLIGLLQQSRVLSSPAFIGQISPDVRTRKERFALNARYDLQADADAVPPPAVTPAAGADGATAPEGAGGDAKGEGATPANAPASDGASDAEAADADAAPAR